MKRIPILANYGDERPIGHLEVTEEMAEHLTKRLQAQERPLLGGTVQLSGEPELLNVVIESESCTPGDVSPIP